MMLRQGRKTNAEPWIMENGSAQNRRTLLKAARLGPANRHFHHVRGLRPFGSLDNFKFDVLAFLE